jgi:hypothetical protein
MKRLTLLATAALASGAAAQPGPAPTPAPPLAVEVRQCGICHGRPEFKQVDPDGTVRTLWVDEGQLATSVHAKWHCIDCHADVDRIPHPPRLALVNCQRCHFPGNPVGAPEEVNYEGYVKSVHGRLRQAGNAKAPACQDCHGGHGVRKPSDAASLVHPLHLPQTCGRCHVRVFAEYTTSAHGVSLLEKGNREAPSCSSCHGEHGILPPKENASAVSATHIPETCSNCHGMTEFNLRYGIPINPVRTFRHTFHGIANELGSVRVANCASCHTAHNILPATDPRSTVNPANIPATCGKVGCHPGANANYARGRFHIDPSSRDAGIIYWVALFFKILTVSTLAALGAHIVLDLVKKLRHRQGATVRD